MVIVFKMVVLTFSICYIVDISGIIQKLNKCSNEHKIIISDIIDAFLKSR